MLSLASSCLPADPSSLLNSLPKCRTLRQADQLHARFLTAGLLRHRAAAAAVVIRLCASPDPPLRLLARRILLSSISVENPFLWNAIIKSSADPRAAMLSFALMLAAGVPADLFSFSLVLKACSQGPSLLVGVQVHAVVLKGNFAAELYIQNCLIGFYAKCGLCKLARRVFDRMPHRDSISWNSLIDGYAKNGRMDAANDLFSRMGDEHRNLVAWNSMISGFAASNDGIGEARKLFDEMPERDSVSWNSMIDGYVKLGMMSDATALFTIMPEKDVISWSNLIAGYMDAGEVHIAQRLFDEMPERDLITWNIMIAGYVKNGCFPAALHLFYQMRTQGNLAPDVTTLSTALSAIAELGRVRDGIALHEYIGRNSFPLNGKLGVGLIDMYAKSGHLREALRVFEASGDTIDHWNAIIGGLAIHGHSKLALQLFHATARLPFKPDDITFIGVLNACSHAGLVDKGLSYFESMRKDYQLEPKLQHYGCMVDMLGRAGRLEDAWKTIEEMPMRENDVIWRSLLSACKKHGDVLMGQKVEEAITRRGFWDSSSFVLLSNIYAGSGMWEDVRRVRKIIREREMRKIPGCSWIELGGAVHEFVVGDSSHPMTREIYSLLELVSFQVIYNTAFDEIMCFQ
ncbi:Pentatricopeptide repeat-containing protein [Apostasia shenzhenica]|uniref:Pentatricopeptide repeat-containing protein n=1 Tax=Apostasia shenzhenica TaxID=1088818 RepID=A0A2H9ZWL4_9ASPA|nr:Pentatricopeptide repeat-containing protein [Apostasia shenzhenica]